MRTLLKVLVLSLSEVHIKHLLKNLRKALLIKQLQQLLHVLLFRHLPLLLRNNQFSPTKHMNDTHSRDAFVVKITGQ